MYEVHEVLGTEKPLYRILKDNQYLLEEIIHLEDNPENYEITGYVPIKGVYRDKLLYQPVYEKRF